MANIRFLLKGHNKVSASEKCSILLVMRLDEKLVYSLSEKVAKQDWDFDAQMPKALKNRSDLAELTLLIRRVLLYIDTEAIKIRNKDIILTKRMMETLLDEYFGKTKKNTDLIWYIKNEYNKNRNDDNIKSATAVAKYISKVVPGVTIDMIDGKLFDKVHSRLIADGKTRNAINYYLKFILRIANDLKKRHDIPFHKSLTNKNNEIPSPEKVRKLALSIDEIIKIYRYQCEDELMMRIKDTYVLMSFIGVRIKDAKNTNGFNFVGIDDEKVYIKDTSKGGSRVIIPLHPVAREIISKYGGRYKFPDVSDYLISKYIKQIAKEAGIEGVFGYTITKGGKKITVNKMRYECVTPHTARRSFATNMHKAGIPPKVAMMFTGHKTFQQYMDYIQITEEEIASEYMNHPFFTGIT